MLTGISRLILLAAFFSTLAWADAVFCHRVATAGGAAQGKSSLPLAALRKLDGIKTDFDSYQAALSAPNAKRISREEHERMGRKGRLAKEYSHLQDLSAKYDALEKLAKEEPDLKDEAEAEQATLAQKITTSSEKIKQDLIEQTLPDAKGAIIQISHGKGGESSESFVFELYQMYQKLAERKGWKVEILEGNKESEMLLAIRGPGAYASLMGEAGVHELYYENKTKGKIYTNVANVVVLPEVRDETVVLREEDVEIKTERGSGPGGQHRNKTETKVDVRHIPTGITASAQTRSQSDNKKTALSVLAARVAEHNFQQQQAQSVAAARSQLGSRRSGDAIRTYDSVRDVVTDHRVGQISGTFDNVMIQGKLEDTLSKLTEYELERLLQ